MRGLPGNGRSSGSARRCSVGARGGGRRLTWPRRLLLFVLSRAGLTSLFGVSGPASLRATTLFSRMSVPPVLAMPPAPVARLEASAFGAMVALTIVRVLFSRPWPSQSPCWRGRPRSQSRWSSRSGSRSSWSGCRRGAVRMKEVAGQRPRGSPPGGDLTPCGGRHGGRTEMSSQPATGVPPLRLDAPSG
jgi:hypothetical protein